ncbi:MAG TPA: plasmid stabilization protein [Pararhizobium sp.]|uniref:plasmid stabilization protein n=1 Tax=Pararhizobium sp. TaxID=1977563 RepID=UPI002B7AAB6D|nr:plasmid stabilization protein [Pararhizobium sp.]HTO33899.1 plasmid stabilization protein [Pararhizobium sp.]
MGDLLIRNISDALKRDIAAVAKRTERSLSDEAKELLRKGLIAESDIKPVEEQSAYDVLRAAVADCLMTDEEHQEFMALIEESRKNDYERPGFGFE